MSSQFTMKMLAPKAAQAGSPGRLNLDNLRQSDKPKNFRVMTVDEDLPGLRSIYKVGDRPGAYRDGPFLNPGWSQQRVGTETFCPHGGIYLSPRPSSSAAAQQ